MVGFEYMLRPILFLVPPGAGATSIEAPQAEAEALRGRFKGCEEGIPFGARAARRRGARPGHSQLGRPCRTTLRKVLDSIPVGQLTAPEVTRHGIEVFAVCAKKETKTDTPGRAQGARDHAQPSASKQESKRYLQELRKNAMIERGK